MTATSFPRARFDGIHASRVGDELIIYDAERQHYHALNVTAAAIWQACDGCRSASTIARDTLLPPDVVGLALSELAELGLLDSAKAVALVDRRAVMKRLAAAGILGAVVLPTIGSMSAPSAAAAGSDCPCGDSSCPGFDGCECFGACYSSKCDGYDACTCRGDCDPACIYYEPCVCELCKSPGCDDFCPTCQDENPDAWKEECVSCGGDPCKHPTCDGYDNCSCDICNHPTCDAFCKHPECKEYATFCLVCDDPCLDPKCPNFCEKCEGVAGWKEECYACAESCAHPTCVDYEVCTCDVCQDENCPNYKCDCLGAC